MGEMLDIYDNNRIKMGAAQARGRKRKKAENILVVMVLIFNEAGEMLIQKRSPYAIWSPDMWTMTAGGAVLAGETPTKAASRELYEELGIKIDFTNSRLKFTMTDKNAFLDYFIVRANVDLSTLNVPNEEVAAAKWASKEEMLTMIDRGECMPYRKSFLEFCFDCADMMECTLTK
ncbi:MAG: NUDIX domain-containing protein [Defluviitaleaceae bacterium]|nr:NUDIX domain-containing protein [Defluviitaleaceae bacterium]